MQEPGLGRPGDSAAAAICPEALQAGPDFCLGQGFAEVRALGGSWLAPWRLWGAAGFRVQWEAPLGPRR